VPLSVGFRLGRPSVLPFGVRTSSSPEVPAVTGPAVTP
jgi:hypothetical protein